MSMAAAASASLHSSSSLLSTFHPKTAGRRRYPKPGPYSGSRICAVKRDYDGKLVDEGMITLRLRIREIEEKGGCGGGDDIGRRRELPSDWTEWEKQYFRTKYNADVCEAVGLLQMLLMDTRPGVALGMAAVLALSVPASAAVVLLQLVGMAKVALGS